MKYWLDTEFIAKPFALDIISVGLAAEDGREFYAESSEVDWSKSTPWTLENVRPKLVADLPGFTGTHAYFPLIRASPCRHSLGLFRATAFAWPAVAARQRGDSVEKRKSAETREENRS